MFFVVVKSWEEEIVTCEQFFKEYQQGVKLLTLYGGEKSELNWGIHNYRIMDSTCNMTVFPATSEEEAVVILKKHVLRKDVDIRIIALAKKYGFDLDEAKVKTYEERELNYRKEAIETKREELDRLLKEVVNNVF